MDICEPSALINDGLSCLYSSLCSHRFGVNDSNNLRKFLTWFQSNLKLHCSVFIFLVKMGHQNKFALGHICPSSSSLQIKAYPEEKKNQSMSEELRSKQAQFDSFISTTVHFQHLSYIGQQSLNEKQWETKTPKK